MIREVFRELNLRLNPRLLALGLVLTGVNTAANNPPEALLIQNVSAITFRHPDAMLRDGWERYGTQAGGFSIDYPPDLWKVAQGCLIPIDEERLSLAKTKICVENFGQIDPKLSLNETVSQHIDKLQKSGRLKDFRSWPVYNRFYDGIRVIFQEGNTYKDQVFFIQSIDRDNEYFRSLSLISSNKAEFGSAQQSFEIILKIFKPFFSAPTISGPVLIVPTNPSMLKDNPILAKYF